MLTIRFRLFLCKFKTRAELHRIGSPRRRLLQIAVTFTKIFLNLLQKPHQESDPSPSDMGGAQALKRIPRIKFPKRHPNPSGSTSQTPSSSGVDDQIFFSSLNENASKAVGGKASLQPKRTPMSSEEIEAILLGGCI